jgi:hypothetical protein
MAHVAAMTDGQPALFVVDLNKDELWDTYLDSFPPGTNEVYRKLREHDCSCCRYFIKQYGNVVAIADNEVITIWDFDAHSTTYQPVIDALSKYVKAKAVADVFVTKLAKLGTEKSRELREGGYVHTWHHFYTEVPKTMVCTSRESESAVAAQYRDSKNVFQRSLEEISPDAVDSVLDLIAENSLYRGEEWCGALTQFRNLQREYVVLDAAHKNNYCWKKSVEVGAALSRIRNHSIGVLLQDITAGMDILNAVKRYEKIVAPSNYKRPKEIFTRKMVEQAQATIEELGFGESLGRRFANLADVTVNNVLFADRDAQTKMNGVGGIMEALKQQATTKPQQFERVPGVGIDEFLRDVLPTATNIELLLENKHRGNLVSLIAPQDKSAPTMFKWKNGLSWAYAGNIADSEMKQRVKAAGGEVGGVLRFSIQWDHNDDLDAHAQEPRFGTHIFFRTKMYRHPSTGMLDVDIIPSWNRHTPPHVENINWLDTAKMPKGKYELYVNCFDHRGGTGFQAEVECDGVIRQYSYNRAMRTNENVVVADVEVRDDGSFVVTDRLTSQMSSVEMWGLNTNQFHKVSLMAYSPNYWDEQRGIGNKHYMFMLAGCVNDETPNGFFNEYLREDMLKHKHVLAALGSMMKVEHTADQLSGLGFSSTKRDAVIARVNGTRVIKIIF